VEIIKALVVKVRLAEVKRIDFVSGSIDALRSGTDRRRNVDTSLPHGRYFLLNSIESFLKDLAAHPLSKFKLGSSTVSNGYTHCSYSISILQYIHFVPIFDSLQCNTKGTLGVHAYSITKTVLKDWLGYNHMETAKAAKINLLPVDKFRIFFRKYVLKEEEEADVVETENREEVAPQEEGDAAIEAQEEGSGEDEDGYGQGEEDLFTVDADPIFNSSTGCLSWMLKDVSSDGEVEEANADEQLLQENQEVGNASLNTSIFPR
jgi:hypothetical protein